jgi:hypothetical protein
MTTIKGDGIEAVIETNPAGGYTIRYRDPEAERMEQVAARTGRADLVTWRKGWAR